MSNSLKPAGLESVAENVLLGVNMVDFLSLDRMIDMRQLLLALLVNLMLLLTLLDRGMSP